MKRILLFTLLTFTLLNIYSQNQARKLNEANQYVLSIKTKQERIEIEYIEVYKDSTNSLTYEEISARFLDKNINSPEFKVKFKRNTNYWLKFQVKNISDNDGEWALEFRDIPFLDIYIIDKSGGLEQLRAGTLIPASEKQMNSGIRETVIFTLQSKEVKSFYVKFRYLFDTREINAISISDSKSFIKQTTIDNLVQGVFQGLLWLMLFYNLFHFISTREKAYLYYIIYVFSFAVLMLHAFQYLQDFIFPENPGVSSYFGITVFVAFTSYFLLLREFIDSRNKHPRIDKSLKIIIIIDAIITVLVFIFQFIYIESFGLVGMQFVFLNAIMLLVYVVIILKIENRISKIFALGTLFLVLWIAIAIIGTFLGGDSDKLIIYFQVGIVGEVFIFSAGLSYKYKVNEQQKQKAQNGLIIQFRENQELQTKVNRELEQEVSKRTEEISQQKDELHSTLEFLKQTQSQLVQTEKMAGIGQLTAGIAHEINNPINYMTTSGNALKNDIRDYQNILNLYAEISQENVEEKLFEIAQLKEEVGFVEIAPETEILLNNIKIGGEKVAEIVKSLRAFTRLDESDLKKVNLHENIDATITILNNRFGKLIEIEKQYSNNLEVECFPGALNQVFLNILNNAIDATKNGGKITVQTQLVADTCQISISDTGKGIPEEIQNRIFEPFFTTKDVGKGTGLGLSTAHTIVKEHHGTIEVESRADKGTTFTIIIPVIQSNNSHIEPL
ncbi:MAG: GHKL domain-containing protein [Bacteroidetes bacterium]|nr:GHKL domain-containing protein [Bacteroidota bacterium]